MLSTRYRSKNMIVSVTLGWAGELSAGISKPLMTCGIAVCLFLLLQLTLLGAYAVLDLWRRRRLVSARLQQLARDVDLARTRHHIAHCSEQGWNGWRKFSIQRKIEECEGFHSFYFVPCDGRQLPPFQPGQYLTFSLALPDTDKPLVRCYSLSAAPGKDYYRCSIKKVASPGAGLPAGRASSLFNDVLQVGDIVAAKAPRGTFCLDMNKAVPIVLLAGGIGITPFVSMLDAVVEEGQARETHLFFGVRNSSEHPFRDHLEPFRRGDQNVRVYIGYSQPLPDDKLDRDYDFSGRITVELLEQVLPCQTYDYYLCGPPAFLDTLAAGLARRGVPKHSIHFESFGSTKKLVKPHRRDADGNGGVSGEPAITFSRSRRTIHWDPAYGTLLDFAEANQVPIESGCRAGNCGTCVTAVISGKVRYPEPPDEEPEQGACLPCVCVPDGPVELDV